MISESFLYQVAEHIHNYYGENTSNLCIVLPNKRASLFLKRHLAKVYNKTIWLPKIISAEIFISEIAEIESIDHLSQITELYIAYKQVLGIKAEPFETFVKWATMLLQDFNECDRYLADTKNLFSNLLAIREVEHWNVDGKELTSFQQNYLHFMENMALVYEEFNKNLLAQNIAYQGLSYRLAFEKIDSFEKKNSDTKFLFCGFNAINLAEEKIIEHLVKAKKAELLWDIDHYYYNNSKQEAGKFLRKHFQKTVFKSESFFSDNLSTQAKKIDIIGIPKFMGQAKMLAKTLNSYLKQGITPDKIAIVLADESLLFSILAVIPAEIQTVNITLEYPLHLSGIYDFIEQLMNLHYNRSKGSNKSSAFYFKDIVKLFHNPYFGNLLSGKAKIENIIKRFVDNNTSYFGIESLKRFLQEDFDDLAYLFHDWNTIDDVINCIEKLLKHIEANASSNSLVSVTEAEFIFELNKMVNRIRSLSNEYDYIEDIKSFRTLLSELVGKASVPFYGEPLQGLQIMGVLETRTLDFENVIFVSVNENMLPSGKSNNSFLPYDLKREFGLPVHQDKDAVYAYHFYRLLQRVKQCTIIYNTQTDEFGSGEKSRFVTQLLNELKEVNKNAEISSKIISDKLDFQKNDSNFLLVKKNETITNKLIERFTNTEKSGFSASSLNNYKDCSLRFYYQYAAEIKEYEDLEENIEASTFGTILHYILEKLYQPYIGKVILPEHIQQMLPLIEDLAHKGFLEHYSDTEVKDGKNFLALNVIIKHSEKLLQKEILFLQEQIASNKYLTISALEKNLETYLDITVNGNNIKVKVSGVIDRIDFTSELFHIIDYKSSVKKNDKFAFSDFETLFNGNKNNNKLFQLFLYAWLVWKNDLCEPEKITPLIIPFRKNEKDREYVKMKSGTRASKENLLFTNELLVDFENHLKAYIQEIFNQNNSFEATSDEKNCEYCTYKDVCGR